jgi:hypothetical protein
MVFVIIALWVLVAAFASFMFKPARVFERFVGSYPCEN